MIVFIGVLACLLVFIGSDDFLQILETTFFCLKNAFSAVKIANNNLIFFITTLEIEKINIGLMGCCVSNKKNKRNKQRSAVHSLKYWKNLLIYNLLYWSRQVSGAKELFVEASERSERALCGGEWAKRSSSSWWRVSESNKLFLYKHWTIFYKTPCGGGCILGPPGTTTNTAMSNTVNLRFPTESPDHTT